MSKPEYIPKYAKLRERILNAPHHFAMLGVHASTPTRDIREARRKLAMNVHPDVNSAHDAHDLMARVNIACRILTTDKDRYLRSLGGHSCAVCDGKGYTSKQISFTQTRDSICATCHGSGVAP
jgi:DnaJ-class molecular chaperone